MRAAVLIAIKDLRQRIRDKSFFLWGIVAPVGLAAIFSLLLGSVADGDSIRVSFGAVDLDGGEVAAVFTGDVLGSLAEAEIVESVVVFGSLADAERAVGAGDVDAVFVLPAGFSAAVGGGGEAPIEVIGYVDSTIGTQVARAVASSFAGEINGLGVAVGTVFAVEGSQPDQAAIDALISEVMQIPAPISVGAIGAADKELDSSTFYSAAMAVMFLFLIVQFGVLGLLEERENGTLNRLLAAPMRRSSVIMGKAITSFVIGVLSMTSVIVITTVALGADWGDPFGVAALVLAGIIAALGLMMLVAAFAKTAEQAGNLQSIAAFLLAMLGGAFFPVAQAGGLIEAMSKITPHAWFLRGLGDLAGGTGLTGILGSVWPILLFAAVTMGLASLRLRRMVAP
ncbi:MAG: ABC transporter permease [Actinobacteria bacterium]|nr:ABC transporter permease [Actinomycetota bacterium]MBU1492404.1 ABC transporter permease [Actinomycetota bacterium]